MIIKLRSFLLFDVDITVGVVVFDDVVDFGAEGINWLELFMIKIKLKLKKNFSARFNLKLKLNRLKID